MRLPKHAWLGVFLVGLVSIAHAELTPAQQLIEKMAAGSRNLSYQGHFFYERGQQSSSYRIVHWTDGKIEKQRLVFLDGPPREMINDGHSLKCLHSGDVAAHEAVQPEINPLAVSGGSLQSVWQNYQANVIGAARVANRQVTRVQLNPKDPHRYPYVFFVDNETGLMVKMQVLDMQGQLLERFQFVHLDVGSVDEKELVSGLKDVVEVAHAASQPDAASNADSGWRLGWVPGGFTQEKAGAKATMARSGAQRLFVYSDGLSAFSVFVEPAPEGELADTSTQEGSTSAVSHVMKLRGGRFLVTVVGEIPIMTAKQIAMAVEPTT